MWRLLRDNHKLNLVGIAPHSCGCRSGIFRVEINTDWQLVHSYWLGKCYFPHPNHKANGNQFASSVGIEQHTFTISIRSRWNILVWSTGALLPAPLSVDLPTCCRISFNVASVQAREVQHCTLIQGFSGLTKFPMSTVNSIFYNLPPPQPECLGPKTRGECSDLHCNLDT